MYEYQLDRLYLRPIAEDDALTVTKWRNTDAARQAFFNGYAVVTPDTHVRFVRNREHNDLVWMVCDTDGSEVGMVSLTVDVEKHKAKFGRLLVSPEYIGKGFAERIMMLAFSFAFDVLHLGSLWLLVYLDNEAAVSLYDRTGWKMSDSDGTGYRGERAVAYMYYYREQYDAI